MINPIQHSKGNINMADLLDPKKLAFAIAKAVAGAAVSKGSSLLIEKLTDLIGLVAMPFGNRVRHLYATY